MRSTVKKFPSAFSESTGTKASAYPRLVTLLALVVCLYTGCAMFQPPPISANGPTVPTGTYDSSAEKWQDEALAAERKRHQEKTADVLRKMDGE